MKKVVYGIIISVLCIMLIGCEGKDSAKEMDTVMAVEQKIDTDEESSPKEDTIKRDTNKDSSEEEIPLNKMQEIIDEIGLENAVAYEEGIEEALSNQIIFLCESPSGHYKAYGFISPEYGMDGILIDNIINQQSNYNFFSQKWVYSESAPALNESDDFYQVTFTICQNQEEGMKEISFVTYDTGTMEAPGWNKM
ncbi:MAG TPA: hypothetical protein H9717_03525 [Candidatus Eisenbergiella merdipullorum]|uniref:Uncharacterized protein n=1 Tax=Candidatus Eisenbergiella merdipullorum TaxID=2838553 RepID=A0A9D2I3E4_9FIRM|nr:hypothetical protein [Candidatus Eisenbergiella merdipullorum]